jgi:hypothetical protein
MERPRLHALARLKAPDDHRSHSHLRYNNAYRDGRVVLAASEGRSLDNRAFCIAEPADPLRESRVRYFA